MKKRGRARHHSRSRGRSLRARTSSDKKFNMILGNLILSAILFVVSFMLERFLANPVLKNFFWMLAMIFGFVGLAFFIIFLIFVVLKVLKK